MLMPHEGKSKLSSQMKRDMQRKAEDVSKEDTRPRRVKFSSLDTIHTFADKSVPCPSITVGKSMPQKTEVENPKTSEYKYFKKLKTFNDQNLACLQNSKSENEHQGLVAYKHFSEVTNGNITDSCVKTKKSIHNQTCISPFPEEKFLEVRAKNSNTHLLKKDKLGPMATSSSHCNIDNKSDLMCSPFQTDFKKAHNYEKVFRRKRKKLQDLCARALSIKKEDLILYGSKSVMILLQRLKVPNNSNIITESQEEDLECSKDISVGIEKKPIQSNFHPETYISTDLKYDFKKTCAQFDILSNTEGLGHTHGNKSLKTKTSNFQHEEFLSLISSWPADKVHHYDYDSYEYGLHELADVDLGTHLLCTKEQLAQKAGIDHSNILDTKFWHFPPVFSRMCSNDYNHKQSLEDFPLFTDILQPDRHYVFDSLPVKRDELGLLQWSDINYKSQKFSSMKSINMQLLDHIDRFKCHRQGLCPETGMILWTLPENSLCFSPLLVDEDKHKHYEKESIPGNSVWGSSYKNVPKCDKIEDFYFQDSSQNFSLAPFLWHNDQDNAGPNLGFSFPSKQLRYGINSWEPKESSSRFLSSEMNLSEVQHKLLNTDGMHLIEEVQGPGVSTLTNFPYKTGETTDSPVKLHLELENDVNIPNICVTKQEEWECLAVPIYPVNLGFSFPSKQLQHEIDSWEPKESSSCFLSSEMNLSEVQHKLLNTDGMHLIEEVQGPGVSSLTNFPYKTRETTDSPVKLHLELENDVNIPNICVTKGKEWECLAVPIYPVNCAYDSYGADHVVLKF